MVDWKGAKFLCLGGAMGILSHRSDGWGVALLGVFFVVAAMSWKKKKPRTNRSTTTSQCELCSDKSFSNRWFSTQKGFFVHSVGSAQVPCQERRG
jgi:hypothetical protein